MLLRKTRFLNLQLAKQVIQSQSQRGYQFYDVQINKHLKVLKPYLDVVLDVEEERQLEVMLWPKLSDGRHNA